jgi:hypothetical protein
MTAQKKMVIENQTLILDGNEFDHCELRHCNLIYKGENVVKLNHCHLVGCTWQFEDAALRTVGMLKGLYVGGPHGKEVVETIFRKA